MDSCRKAWLSRLIYKCLGPKTRKQKSINGRVSSPCILWGISHWRKKHFLPKAQSSPVGILIILPRLIRSWVLFFELPRYIIMKFRKNVYRTNSPHIIDSNRHSLPRCIARIFPKLAGFPCIGEQHRQELFPNIIIAHRHQQWKRV